MPQNKFYPLSPKAKTQLVSVLLHWYRQNARTLPWRQTRNPYCILVSEVMLQQTQVSRVLRKYLLFIKRFPSFRTLARATKSDVIREWHGLGYNNRAVRLQRLAQMIAEKYQGRLPSDIEEMQNLPGIGKYTSRAVLCFAFGKPFPLVDTNIHRVISRMFVKESKRTDSWKLAEYMLPCNKSYEWNQALIELGALICTVRNPRCSQCPWQDLCPSAYKIRVHQKIKSNIEPNILGIPNRIYRGKIIGLLSRNSTGKAIGIKTLLTYFGFTKSYKPALLKILHTLERDGLLSISSRREHEYISLPK